jgi:hypothetical protein
MSEYLRELWEHRGDGYYWADHQLELAVLAALAAGLISLAFKWAELRLEASMSDAVIDGG